MRQLNFSLVFMLLLVAGIPAAFAQKRTISGKVSEPNGKIIPFVNITVKGTTVGTTSNDEGLFSIDVPDGSRTLVFSIAGYKTQEVTLSTSNSLDVMLTTDVSELEAVVVTALGIERKAKSLGYSVTTVGGENLTQARELSVVNALEGRVAGVDVSKIASGPGASTRVIIRGTKTLGSTLNQPLYVIDGIPMDNSNNGQAGRWGGGDQGDGMSSINPDDVASISVLKGASASALYGSRAANGVILITTKKGSARRGVGVEVNTNYVLEKIINLTDFQTSHGSGGMVGATLQTRVATRPTSIAQAFGQDWNQQAWGPRFDGSPTVQFDGVSRPYSYAGDNWKRFYETGNTLTNSIALTGGNENQNIRLSVADLKSNAVIPNSGFDRINVALSGSAKLGKRISMTAKVLYSNEKAKNRPNVSDSPGNAVQSIYRLPGDINILDLIGDPAKPGAVPSVAVQTAKGITIYDGKKPGEEFQRSTDLWTQNPYWAAYQQINSDTRDRILPSVNIKYDITDFLYLQGQAGMDWSTQRGSVLLPEGTGHNRGGDRNEYERRVRETNYQWTAGFNKAFYNDKIGVNAFIGGNRMRRSNEFLQADGGGFSVFLVPSITNARDKSFGYNFGESGINSLFGQVEVSYKNYLFVTGMARKDWFSVLDPEDNSILYPSVTGSFVFTDAFTIPAPWLTYGKLRLAWAQVGNVNSVNPYSINLAYAPFSTHVGVPFGGYSTGVGNASTFPNPALKPFTSTEVEYGLEARFFNNRLGIDFTYYDQKTTNDILNGSISRASGFNATTVNLGKISNKGVEILLTGTPVKGTVTWDVSLNFSKNKSRVVSLVPGQLEVKDANDDISEPRTRNVLIKNIVGYPYGMITGKVQSKDPSGNLVFNEDGSPVSDGKYYIIGQGVPDFIGGVNNSLSWKQVNLSFLIDFKFGGDIFSGTNMRMTQQGFHKQTLLGRDGEAPLILTGVSPDGAGGFKPFSKTYTPGEAQNYWNQLGQESAAATEQFVYDASFIKLRQLTLGYTLPKKIFGKLPVQSLMVSFVGRNLAILHKNTPNIDPEANYNSTNNQGFDYFGLPSTRTFGFNVRATF